MKKIDFVLLGLIASFGALSACQSTSSDVVITELQPSELPAGVTAVVMAERTDFTPLEVEMKVRDGRTYYDIEGKLSSGEEIEFDVLETKDGPQVVEIQRDLAWEQMPVEVQAKYSNAVGDEEPVRIIESIQTDGSVVYEFFVDGQPKDPKHEIRTHAGKVELLDKRWEH